MRKSATLAVVLAVVSTSFLSAFLFNRSVAQAQTISCDTPAQKVACQAEYERLEAERKQAEAAAAVAQAKSSSYERDIALLRAKIKAAELDIRAKNILIQTLGKDISSKQSRINQLEAKIARGKETLADLFRKTNELDQYSLSEVILSESSVTEFFHDIDSFNSLQNGLKEAFEEIRADQASTTAEKEALDVRRSSEVDARYEIQQKQKQIEANQKELQKLLSISDQNKKAYSALAAQKAAQAAQILAALFPLAGSKAIPFGEALKYANIVYQKTGVQPAFLLALLKQETNIGANVGTCYMTNSSDGSGINTRTNNYVPNVMKATRDVQPFLSITSALGYDYMKTPVSCPQSIGYGGGMGPAQFIPSTWVLFEGRLKAILGAAPNPWKPMDSFMAAGLYLSDLGGASTRAVSTTAQKNAACRYYSGRVCGAVSGSSSYANNILSMAYSGYNSMQSQIDLVQGY